MDVAQHHFAILLAAKPAPSRELPGVFTVAVPTNGVHPGGRQNLVANVCQHLIIAGEGGGHAASCMHTHLSDTLTLDRHPDN